MPKRKPKEKKLEFELQRSPHSGSIKLLYRDANVKGSQFMPVGIFDETLEVWRINVTKFTTQLTYTPFASVPWQMLPDTLDLDPVFFLDAGGYAEVQKVWEVYLQPFLMEVATHFNQHGFTLVGEEANV